MPHEDIFLHFKRIDNLTREIDLHAPIAKIGTAEIRSDLAGLLVVSIVAMYETCVKETMSTYAGGHGARFQGFIERNYEKLSSKIEPNDLKRYAKTFDPALRDRFVSILNGRKRLVSKLTGKNIETQLGNLLDWRHKYAHAGLRQTTIEEAISTHRLAQVVILSFHDAFFPKQAQDAHPLRTIPAVIHGAQ